MGGIGDQRQRVGQHTSGGFGGDNREVESDRWRKRTAVRMSVRMRMPVRMSMPMPMPMQIAMQVVVRGHGWNPGCRRLRSRRKPAREASATTACNNTL